MLALLAARLLVGCAPDVPAAETRCDGRDEDRDGVADDGVTGTWYADNDGDGVGTNATALTTCSPPEGYVATAGDCDDGDPAAHPGAVETCAGPGDEDCDGVADPAGAAGCVDDWPDADGDGLGEGEPTCVCAPTGVAVGGDCDGTDVDRGTDCAEGATETVAGDRLWLDDPDAYWSLLGAGDFDAGGGDGDVDGDGAPVGATLALVSTDERFALAAVPDGDIALSVATRALYDTPTWTRPRLGDLDGDGVIDLLAPTGAIGDALLPTLGVTPGPLAAPGVASAILLDPVVSAEATESLFVADLDGDGAPEGWYALGAAGVAGQVAAWRFDGAGATAIVAPGEDRAGALTKVLPVGDLDGDGFVDLGVYEQGDATALRVTHGPLATLPEAADADATLDVPALDDVVALGDVDGDGLSDVGLREARIWVLTTVTTGALADVAHARIGPESDATDDSALFVAAGDVGADGARELLVTDTFWPVRTGAGNLRGALYVFDALPSGIVDARAAGRRVYGEGYGLFGAFPTVLDDGRIAVGAPLLEGEGALGAVWVIDAG